MDVKAQMIGFLHKSLHAITTYKLFFKTLYRRHFSAQMGCCKAAYYGIQRIAKKQLIVSSYRFCYSSESSGQFFVDAVSQK